MFFINSPLQTNDWGTHLNSRKNHSYLAALNYGQVHCARLPASLLQLLSFFSCR
jgi:hypothetical protein